MNEDMLIKECEKCGAPLIIRSGELVCDYCGTRYELPEKFRKEKLQTTPKPQLQQLESQHPKTLSTSLETVNEKRSGYGRFFVAILIFGVFVAMFLWWKSDSNKPSTQLDPESQTELKMYDSGEQGNPADFIHESPLSLGIVYSSSVFDGFDVELSVQNNTDIDIEGSSKMNHLMIDSLSVSDNTGRAYTCDYTYEVKSKTVEPGEVTTISYIHCKPDIKPEVKFLTVDVSLANWGSYNFQIPFSLNLDDLEIVYTIDRFDDSCHLLIHFHSEKPAPVQAYFRDITLVDSIGKTYQCDPSESNHVKEQGYKSFIVAPGFNTYIDCNINEPIASNVNAITLVMTIRGQTVTLTTPIDTIEGQIIYDQREK